jgi:hypothetical protein
MKKSKTSMEEYWDVVQRTVCPATIAGWLWYCDEHGTHGNADSEDEAAAMVDVHVRYFTADTARREHAATIYVWQVGGRRGSVPPLDPEEDAG